MVTPSEFIAIAWSGSKKGLNSFRHSPQWVNFCLKTEKDIGTCIFLIFFTADFACLGDACIIHDSGRKTTSSEKLVQCCGGYFGEMC